MTLMVSAAKIQLFVMQPYSETSFQQFSFTSNFSHFIRCVLKQEGTAQILGVTKNKGWEYVRENVGFKNKTFATLSEVEQNLCDVVLKLLGDKEKVKSLTGFSWVLDAISDIMIAVLYGYAREILFRRI